MRIALWSMAALLLILPFIGMQFSDEIAWGPTDFAIMAVLLAVVGGTIEMAVRKNDNPAYRLAVVVAMAAGFILVVVNGAVGIIGSSGNQANLMFGGVLVIAALGAVVARFQAPRMARAMVVTALAQTLVAVIALAAGSGAAGPNWPQDLLMATGLMAGLWLLSAWLFRRAYVEPDWSPWNQEGSEAE